jgi:hypothetical protein
MLHSSLCKGKRVVARCHDGTERENVVWETGKDVVYLCSEAQFQALKEGRSAAPPIGFPLRVVEPVA